MTWRAEQGKQKEKKEENWRNNDETNAILAVLNIKDWVSLEKMRDWCWGKWEDEKKVKDVERVELKRGWHAGGRLPIAGSGSWIALSGIACSCKTRLEYK
jgi:hypothetical protein